jgi:putative ABC transport system ATP-binding protein
MAPETPDVRLDGVRKVYGSHTVLCDTVLEVSASEFIVILGRSGTGKSTLLNLIGGLDDPTDGEVFILGQRLAALTESARSRLRAASIGFVFQFFNLIPTLSAIENVELPLVLNRRSKMDARIKAQRLLEDLELAASAHRFPEELSGGEQQRVAIARAIAHDPKIVLADEPTGNLDADTGALVLSLLTDLCRRKGRTLIMATHSDEVVGQADRVLRISNAKLEEMRF